MKKARGCNRTVLRQIVLGSTDTFVNLLLSMAVRELHTEKNMLVLYGCLILILVYILSRQTYILNVYTISMDHIQLHIQCLTKQDQYKCYNIN